MDSHGLAAALDLAARQRGLVTRRQLYDLGVAPRTLHRRIVDGLWIPHGRSVLRLRGTEYDLATASRIAGLQVCGAILTGPSAAAVHGQGPWDTVDLGDLPWLVSRPRQRVRARFVSHPGIRYRLMDRWLVACVADAVVDLIRFLPRHQGKAVAYRAIQTQVITLGGLHEAGEGLIRCAGARQLTSIVRDVAGGAHSDAELKLINMLREAGIGGWYPNHTVVLPGGVAVVDVAFPDMRLAVEVDGRAWHSDAKRFQSDRSRQNQLVRAGWTVLRFTWADLTDRPDRVIHEIRECVYRLSA